MEKSKHVLVAPLDWGLGHATRCVPIINELLKRKARVSIACSGRALILLRHEFPELPFFEIASYGVHYSRIFPFSLSILLQVPKFLLAIRKEERQIRSIVQNKNVDIIISDNRYGCRTSSVQSIFITHQVNVIMPPYLKWLNELVNYFNHAQIKKFSQCWVPDHLENRISGVLTDSRKLQLSYIGMISRFEKSPTVSKRFDLLILLSGPEPHRTIMEDVILKQVKDSKLKIMIVRGLPGVEEKIDFVMENVSVENHLDSCVLNKVIEDSQLVICRSGYSTIMDLAKLGKKAIFIATPGQTEQEYLAEVLSKKKIAFSTTLDDLKLASALEISQGYSGFDVGKASDLLLKQIDQLLL
jgi:uncharacterized protein (TIGR00661 family)